MGNQEFSALDKLAYLEQDAKKAASLIDEVEEGSDAAKKNDEAAKKIEQTAHVKPNSLPNQQQEQTRHVSTRLRVATHRRVMRAAKLQAADEKLPDSFWAILDDAANQWCNENGY